MLGMIVSIWKKLHVYKKPPTDNTICRLGFLCVVMTLFNFLKKTESEYYRKL